MFSSDWLKIVPLAAMLLDELCFVYYLNIWQLHAQKYFLELSQAWNLFKASPFEWRDQETGHVCFSGLMGSSPKSGEVCRARG